MLTSLLVKNYALIKDLEIDFESGFSTITGETGAGKSILLGALSLLLGQRADTSVLSDPTTKCIVEGNFQIYNYDLEKVFKEYEIDFDENTIIRREINPNGKSRAFVNDTPVNLSILKSIGNTLVEVHSQHQTLDLVDTWFQIEVIDTYADNLTLLVQFQQELEQLHSLQRKYDDLIRKIEKYREEKELLEFQYEELDHLELKPGEEEDLEEELEKLTHAEEIRQNLGQVSEILEGEQINTLSKLKEALIYVEKTGKFLPSLKEIFQRMESVYLDLKDISLEVGTVAEAVVVDPHRLEYVRDRVDAINRLFLKYQVKNTSGLIDIKDQVNRKLQGLADSDFHKEEIQKQINHQQKRVTDLAEKLDNQRMKAIPDIEKVINGLLKQLGMPEGEFKVEITKTSGITMNGISNVRFLFSANSGTGLKELSKVASGGELSRLMLSLKALMAEKVKLPTIIFDEIDAGVSGEVADKVGNIIRKMSKNRQVFNITHLPQVASKGKYHYKVFKENVNGEVQSRIKLLSADERRTEIAQMLSGEGLSEAAFRNADELLRKNV